MDRPPVAVMDRTPASANNIIALRPWIANRRRHLRPHVAVTHTHPLRSWIAHPGPLPRFRIRPRKAAPPYTWGGMLSTDATLHAQREMQTDTIVLRDLENAQNDPSVCELLNDIYAELFPPPVKVAMFAYQKDRFSVDSADGHSTLSPMLDIGAADESAIERVHLANKRKVRETISGGSSLVTRMRCSIHSNVAEENGLYHRKVTKKGFCERYSAKRKKLAWRFSSRRHKLNTRFTDILGRRTWKSPSPEAGRVSIAAWQWARARHALPQEVRPSLLSAQFSSMLSKGMFVIGPDNVNRLCVGSAKWGALSLQLTPVVDNSEEPWRLAMVSWGMRTFFFARSRCRGFARSRHHR